MTDEYKPMPKWARERRLLAAHHGQRVSWRVTDGRDYPVTTTHTGGTMRAIDWSGHVADDDGLTLSDYWMLQRLDAKLDAALAVLGREAA